MQLVLETFKASSNLVAVVYCGSQNRAEALRDSLKGHSWFNCYVKEFSHYGQPIAGMLDEHGNNIGPALIPNDKKSYGVVLQKKEAA